MELPGEEKKKTLADSVNDYYVKGEGKQGILFYVFVALIVLFIIALLGAVYDYLRSFNMEMLWSAAYFMASLAIGVFAGIFLYNMYSRLKYIQVMLRNSLVASPQQFPGVYGMVKLAAERLSMKPVDAYVAQNPMINAYSVRLGLIRSTRLIVINTGLLEAMEGDELLFIIGHELSHIKYGRWRRLKPLPIPFIDGPQYVEYRCDRGGLVANRNMDAAIMALYKLVTGKRFIGEIKPSVEKDKEKRLTSNLLLKLSTHPMIDARIAELKRFYESNFYQYTNVN